MQYFTPEGSFDGPMARVMKTAGFKGNRRMGVAFIGTREGDKDNGRVQYAGNGDQAITKRDTNSASRLMSKKWNSRGNPSPALMG